ncbi:oligopeptide transport system ATP-binding protein [Ureibacillus xyleni]|uniref:Oligopeptide transport system ATP-binding protein n=1 Tax=Ureibacillus xyleni TaxID=614648 RepID=A0A285S5H2_9BACL|nr:oligopeptide/dipeptide ABC transporter ATP-binding protein [Ureibacillus xyleni]SOC00164.1 oligopeptide transport system ATP-binding protein [Ureibacillus xyleni]
MSNVLLKVNKIKKYFPKKTGSLKKNMSYVKAVDDVSFEVFEGETLGIVGESGCGKSTTGRMIMRLLEPTDGSILFEDVELSSLSKTEMRKARRDIQMVFQDPYASLNPRHTVKKILEEPLIVHGIGDKKERQTRVEEYLEIVGLSAYHAQRYPHQFSGGQRQRIGIARALMTNPKLIIADEPVSALDVSIQAQVLNLMKRLQEDLKLTYIFIAHDLGVVRHISDRVGVMYLGRLVEIAPSESLYAEPLHPYSQALLSAVPIPDPTYQREQIMLTGDTSSSTETGCTFQLRCPYATTVCKMNVPELVEVRPGHSVACHLVGEQQ